MYAALSFRSDILIDPDRLGNLVETLRDEGLEPILVSQVKRDDVQHLRLAHALDIKVVSWDGRTHAEQLQRVQDAYARSRVVVSNRLHALIFGMQEGAVPVAMLDGNSDKLLSTLEHVLPIISIPTSLMGLDSIDWHAMFDANRLDDIRTSMEAAREHVTTLKQKFDDALRHRYLKTARAPVGS
jgi:hypothetical protein